MLLPGRRREPAQHCVSFWSWKPVVVGWVACARRAGSCAGTCTGLVPTPRADGFLLWQAGEWAETRSTRSSSNWVTEARNGTALQAPQGLVFGVARQQVGWCLQHQHHFLMVLPTGGGWRAMWQDSAALYRLKTEGRLQRGCSRKILSGG